MSLSHLLHSSTAKASQPPRLQAFRASIASEQLLQDESGVLMRPAAIPVMESIAPSVRRALLLTSMRALEDASITHWLQRESAIRLRSQLRKLLLRRFWRQW